MRCAQLHLPSAPAACPCSGSNSTTQQLRQADSGTASPYAIRAQQAHTRPPASICFTFEPLRAPASTSETFEDQLEPRLLATPLMVPSRVRQAVWHGLRALCIAQTPDLQSLRSRPERTSATRTVGLATPRLQHLLALTYVLACAGGRGYATCTCMHSMASIVTDTVNAAKNLQREHSLRARAEKEVALSAVNDNHWTCAKNGLTPVRHSDRR